MEARWVKPFKRTSIRVKNVGALGLGMELSRKAPLSGMHKALSSIPSTAGKKKKKNVSAL
jgi:hypothetical protein